MTKKQAGKTAAMQAKGLGPKVARKIAGATGKAKGK